MAIVVKPDVVSRHLCELDWIGSVATWNLIRIKWVRDDTLLNAKIIPWTWKLYSPLFSLVVIVIVADVDMLFLFCLRCLLFLRKVLFFKYYFLKRAYCCCLHPSFESAYRYSTWTIDILESSVDCRHILVHYSKSQTHRKHITFLFIKSTRN